MNTRLFLLFLLFTKCTDGLTQKLQTEDVFKRYLVSHDQSVAKTVINSKDGLYSLFCQGDLTDDPAKKINLFTEFIRQNPKYGMGEAYLNRGIANSMSEKYDSAVADCSEAISINKKEPYAYYFRGESYLSLTKYDKAIDDFNESIKLNPSFVLAYHMRGICFLSQKNSRNALSDFNRVIELDKNYDQAYLLRGVVYDEMGEFKKAVADWNSAKKINKKDTKEADELIEKANKKMREKKTE